MIKYTIGPVTTFVRQWFFPDGCVGVNINIGSDLPYPEREDILVTMVFGSTDEKGNVFSINDDLLALAQTMDALRHQYPVADFYLMMPYIPYARQDRACNPGDSFALRVVGNMINSMGFKTISAVDAHNESTTQACFNNLYLFNQFDVFGKVRNFAEVYIVAPDQGATKKSENFAKAVGAKGVITCQKVRNLQTGEIIGMRVLDKVPEGADLFVLDDLCDGGRTFIEVASALTERAEIGSLELAITHGLFTKGVSTVKMHFDKIYTTNSFISNKDGCEVIDIL